ncbi:MAG: prepilin-type N-terminal cleavage/methylation domain-containing protein [Planctomycetota bacterium]
MRSNHGMTLFELVITLMILAAIAGLAAPVFSGTVQSANEVATKRSLEAIRDALANYWQDTKWVGLDGVTTVGTESNRLSIAWLFSNPVTDDSTFDFDLNTRIGWRGPYISESTGDLTTFGTATLVDAWNQAIVVQDVDSSASLRDVRVVSGGPDGTIDTPSATATSALTSTDVGDDLYVAFTLR